MRKLFAWLLGGKPVLLRDRQGRTYKSIAYQDPFSAEDMWASVFWTTGVGHVLLHPNGTTSGDASYITQWRFG